MTKKNDAVIIELQKKVDEKRANLKAISRFAPITNCSLELDSIRSNIQVLQRQDIVTLLVKLNAYKTSAEQLELIDEYTVSGFHVNDWIKDLQAKLAYLGRKAEEKKLNLMETKLHQLLSDGKKTEIELDAMMKDLDA